MLGNLTNRLRLRALCATHSKRQARHYQFRFPIFAQAAKTWCVGTHFFGGKNAQRGGNFFLRVTDSNTAANLADIKSHDSHVCVPPFRYLFYANSLRAASSAASMPETSLPPACAMVGLPPPPPLISREICLITAPALKPFSTASSVPAASRIGVP